MSYKSYTAITFRVIIAAFGATLCRGAPARAAVSLSLTPVGGSAVTAGAVVPVQVYLNGPTTLVIAGLQFDVAAITGGSGATLTSGPTTPDGFDESPVSVQLDFAISGELTDTSTIALAQASGTGILAGSDHLLIGTFWVKTPQAVAASYTVSLASAQITTLSPVSSVPIATSNATIITSVPEPTSAAIIVLGGRAFGRRRSR